MGACSAMQERLMVFCDFTSGTFEVDMPNVFGLVAEHGGEAAARAVFWIQCQATRALHPSTRSLPGYHPGGRVEGAGG